MALRTLVKEATGEEFLWNDETGDLSPLPKRPVDLADPSTIGSIVKGAGEGAMAGLRMPLDIARNLASARNIDPRELSPGVLWEAAKGTGADIARGWPEIVGGVAGGALGGPWGAVGGAAGMRGVAEAIGGASPQEVARGVAASATTGALPLGMARGLQAAPKLGLRGIAAKRFEPGMVQAFERQRVPYMLPDVAQNRMAGIGQNIAGKSLFGSEVVAGAERAQPEAFGAAMERTVPEAMRQLGAPGRIAVGTAAKESAGAGFDALRTYTTRLKAGVMEQHGKSLIALDNLKEEAKRLAVKDLPEDIAPLVRTIAGETIRQPGTEITRTIPGRPGNLMQDVAATPATTTSYTTGSSQAYRGLAENITLREMDDLIQDIGARSRGGGPLANPESQQIAKALYRAAMQDLDAAPTAGRIPKAGIEAYDAYRQFYKDTFSKLNESRLGKFLSGKWDPEDATKLLTKNGIREAEDLLKFAGEGTFTQVRDAAFAEWMRAANVVDTNSGTVNPGNFGKMWRKIDPEVKAKLFPAEVQADLNELAMLAGRMGEKYTAKGGGSPSGTPNPLMVLGQGGAALGTGSKMFSGDPTQAVLGAIGTLAVTLGPYGLAKLLTTPGGIRWMTTVSRLPAGSQESAALLGIIQAGQEGERRRREFLEVEKPTPR